jgi:hypothetical protein
MPVAARSEAWVCGLSIPGIAGLNPTGYMDVCPLLILCVMQVEVSETGRPLVQGNPTDWCVCY